MNSEEIIRRIEEIGGHYNPDCGLTIEDQLLACEAVAESTPILHDYSLQKENTNENGSVSGSDNGSCKRGVKFELTESKLRAISELKQCNHKSSPKDISERLEIIFQEFPSNDGFWLKVAQYHTPRQINWSLNQMIKMHTSGRIRKTPAAYFTNDIIHRKGRKHL